MENSLKDKKDQYEKECLDQLCKATEYMREGFDIKRFKETLDKIHAKSQETVRIATFTKSTVCFNLTYFGNKYDKHQRRSLSHDFAENFSLTQIESLNRLADAINIAFPSLKCIITIKNP